MTDKTVSIRTSHCRGCGSRLLWQFLDLGNQALPWFIRPGEPVPPRAFLRLVKCSGCHLVQLSESVDRDLLFRKFWYRSGISSTIRDDLKDIAVKGHREADLSKGDTVLDIGSNDGTLLRQFTNSVDFQESPFGLIGFEPAENVIEDSGGWASIVNDYFTAEKFYERFDNIRPKLITAIGMYYDLEDPTAFTMDIAKVLHPEGVLVVQQNHLPTMLRNVTYDNACHEHLTYFSLHTLQPILKKAGLECYHVELNSINGGSFRTYIAPIGQREVDLTVHDLLMEESRLGLDARHPYYAFAEQVKERRTLMRRFLDNRAKETGIYGASTRGSTIVQYCGLDDYGLFAVDNNLLKSGRLMPGTQIMIHDRSMVHTPKYYILLPHHLRDEITRIEKEYVEKGGKFVIPLPRFEILP